MVINSHNHCKSGEILGCEDYIQRLEEERVKVLAFQRELPFCLELVTQAIDSCKEQLSGTRTGDCDLQGQSERHSEQTTSDVPVFAELFLPVKRPLSPSICNQEGQSMKPRNDELDSSDDNSRKLDWLKSAQLWDPPADPQTKEVTPKRVGMEWDASTTVPAAGESNENDDQKEEESNRKVRRVWTAELHQKFLGAVEKLGGTDVAKPKQIRELMAEEQLTSEEIRSHLQRFRLHGRGPKQQLQPASEHNPIQLPNFASLWILPRPYTAVVAHTVAASHHGIYAPVTTASASSRDDKKKSTSGGESTDSPPRSSSTQTTTSCPPS